MCQFMANKRRARRRRPLWVPGIKEGLSLGTLAASALTTGSFANTLSERAYLISMDVVLVQSGFTAQEGPIIVGVSHSDYTSAEVEEWFEASAQWAIGDLIAQEAMKRKCRLIGTLGDPANDPLFNDGKPVRVKCGWWIEEGQTVQIWVYNDGTAALTTGAIVELNGKAYFRLPG